MRNCFGPGAKGCDGVLAKNLLYARHRWRAEGVLTQAKTRCGPRRAARRVLDNVRIQVYLTASTMNLKRLAAFFLLFAWLQRANYGDSRSAKPFNQYKWLFICRDYDRGICCER
jgi:hypothetical protein